MLLLLLGAAACRPSATAPDAETQQVLEGFTMTQTTKGSRQWEIRSPEARVTLRGESLLATPEIRFFRNDRHVSTAKSKTASIHAQTGAVRLQDEVVIVSVDQKAVLRTQRLDYTPEDQKFRTDEPLTIERPGVRIRGKGLVADAGLSDVTLYHQETSIVR
ncbi:MAG: LPS export ABC transporter periplasmic protein LptC [Elusimicrobia bacterium GWA2_69_24]|nr:MAG: LPS export ABC transporter periplasmic protein LptC [Elusimicrobia bacterium GWA2_69_24]